MDDLRTFPCARLKMEEFFLRWMADNKPLIGSMLEDVKAGRPVQGTAPLPPGSQQTGSHCPLSPSTAPINMFASTPPLSPSRMRSPRSPMSVTRRSMSSLRSSLNRTPPADIGRFFFPTSAEEKLAAVAEFQKALEKHFKPENGQSLERQEFVDMAAEVCKLPTMIGFTLFRRLAGSDDGKVTKDKFVEFCTQRGMLLAPADRRVFDSLRQDGKEYLTHDDFMPLMDCLLLYHPGLEFLKETAEFQNKYAETVVYRIFYTLNRSDTGRLTYRELKRGDLLAALQKLDNEDDINQVLQYFSYEHFYVLYCKFWELDTDHDFMIDKDNLAHYSQCALSYQIIERIFEQAARPFTCKEAGKMGYEDFVWFILSEEDKSSDTSIDYWFKCADLDCDGVIRPREMWFFYEEQLKRLESFSQEPVPFDDMVCQMHDMLAPAVEGGYTVRDLRRVRKTAGLLFNALFNLNKFISYENRDPFVARNEAVEFAGLSDWEKFARIEYHRLSCEDDQGSMEADEGPWLSDG